jgi:hypothetical protein
MSSGIPSLAGRASGSAEGRTPARALPLRRAAAVLTVASMAVGAAGITGCGVFAAPSAPSGMEKQIEMGQRAAAGTHAHSAQSAKDALSSSQRVIPGRDVTAIGDSVMSASVLALQAALPGIYIDAQPDREMPAGLAIVRRLAASGQLRPIVVLGLGTNYIVTTAQLQQLMRLIGPHRKLVLVNTYVQDGWSKQVNATEAAFVQQHPDVVLADWYDTIKDRLYLLWPDKVHPLIPGTTVYAHMVYNAVQATRDVTGPSTASHPAAPGRAIAAPRA